MEYKNIKRAIDVMLSSFFIVLLSPVFIITSIIVKLESKGPIIYKQKRTGLNEKEFVIYKFRTMSEDNDVNNFNEDDKVTSIGKFLRRIGVDELPQLINILKGDMSFIGPRPFLTAFNQYYSEEQKKRLNVLPGLLGPTNCLYKDTDIFEKINIDIDYVENYSFKTDVKLLTACIRKYKDIMTYRKAGSCGNKKSVIEELNELEIAYNNAHNIENTNDKNVIVSKSLKEEKIESRQPEKLADMIEVKSEECYKCDYYWSLYSLVTKFEENNIYETKNPQLVKGRCANYK